MFQRTAIQRLCATFLAVFEAKVHEAHMNHAPDAPFLCGYLHATTLYRDNALANG